MISISISFEESEMPAAKQLLAGICGEVVSHNSCRLEKCDHTEKVESVILQDNASLQTESKKKKPTKTEKVPLTDEQKAQILEMHAKGFGIQDIKLSLGVKDARQVWGWIMRCKGMLDAKNVAPIPQSPVAEVRQEEVQSPKKEPEVPRTEAKPAENLDPHSFVNKKIVAMRRQGAPFVDIAAFLGRVAGGSWTGEMVEERLRTLGEKGAA